VSGFRLPAPSGSRLNRGIELSFKFDGRAHRAFSGDTLAAALLASGERLVGRSFKLHRPRGIFSCGVEEPNAIVDVLRDGRRHPNGRATCVEVEEGLAAEPVNCRPSLRFDVGALTGLFSSLVPAGFYYKTFKWPNWHFFEPSIRRMAGLGRVERTSDRDRYDEVNLSVDVAVIGAGCSGLAAAISAAEAGARVLLISSAPMLGGTLAWADAQVIAPLASKVRDSRVQVLTRTTAFGLYDHNLVCAREFLASPATGAVRERLWKIRAGTVIAATGAFERPVVFPDNDRPGVMLAGAADKYAQAYGVACGRRAVIAANCDRAYAVAQSLAARGIEIEAIVDRRKESDVDAGARSGAAAKYVLFDSVIRSVRGARGVQGCTAGPADSSSKRALRMDCDLILSAGGLTPAVHLHSQAGGKLEWLQQSAMFVPVGPNAGVASVGACAGIFEREAAMEHAAAVAAAMVRGEPAPSMPARGIGRSLENTHVAGLPGKQYVDLQNDVTADDIALAVRENYRSVEHLKRYTTTGMGTDQGKTSNVNAISIVAEQTRRPAAEVGTTKFRPPFVPISIGLIAGRRTGALFRPLKRLSAQAWHQQRGASFEEYGGWWRPAAYPRPGESIEAAARREARTTREAVGLFDGSPLGKLEVFGPDAGRFLDLMYVGILSTLAVGHCRYGLLLHESGVVADDGVVARLGPSSFWVTTSSSGAERTAAAFDEWLQCEYPDMRVLVSSVTSSRDNVTLAGPKAWRVLEAAGASPELAPASCAHMSVRDAAIDGIEARVLRASFCGELGYEIYVPAGSAAALFARLHAIAADMGGAPYGVEALQIMRVEKGYIHIGTDTDGTTLPGDLGLASGIAKKQANFVGRRSLLRPASRDPDRLQLAGLIASDRRTLLPIGAQIAKAPPPSVGEGYITSSVHSDALGYPVSLCMLAGGSRRLGETVRVFHLGKLYIATVVDRRFFDPAGSRLNG
jgi:sarcosine oxidase subunit alpha